MTSSESGRERSTPSISAPSAPAISPPGRQPEPHYPSIKPELVELTVALHGLAHDAASRATFLADAAGYADRFPLTAEQRTTLIALDTRAIVAMGAHPLVPFLAKMQVERQRRG